MRRTFTPILIIAFALSIGAGVTRAGSLSGFVEFLKTLRDRLEQAGERDASRDDARSSNDESASKATDSRSPGERKSKSSAASDRADASTSSRPDDGVRFELSGKDPTSTTERKRPGSEGDPPVEEARSIGRTSKSGNNLVVFDLNGERPAPDTALPGATDRTRRGGVFANATDTGQAFVRSSRVLAQSVKKRDPVADFHRQWAGLDLHGPTRAGRPGIGKTRRIPAFQQPPFVATGGGLAAGRGGKGDAKFDKAFEGFRDSLFKDIEAPTGTHGPVYRGNRGFFEILADFFKNMDSITLGLLALVGFGLFSLLWSLVRSPA